MITIYYKPGSQSIISWNEQLERIMLKHEFVEEENAAEPHLVDGENVVQGETAINAYLYNQEQFVNGWYEDRCDKYDFDPDAPLKIKGVNE